MVCVCLFAQKRREASLSAHGHSQGAIGATLPISPFAKAFFVKEKKRRALLGRGQQQHGRRAEAKKIGAIDGDKLFLLRPVARHQPQPRPMTSFSLCLLFPNSLFFSFLNDGLFFLARRFASLFFSHKKIYCLSLLLCVRVYGVHKTIALGFFFLS